MERGAEEFNRIWGQRDLEDNWRRSNKQPVFQEIEEELLDTGAVVQLTPEQQDSVKFEEYKANLPFSAEARDSSNTKLTQAHFQLGMIYYEDLKELKEAIPNFKAVIDISKDPNYVLPSAYTLYLIYKDQNSPEADTYKNYIFTYYPNSEIAEIIRDPEGFKERQQSENDQLDDYLALFGFGVNTILDLPEARSGLLPTRRWKEETRGLPWYPGDTVNIGIGQGDMLVTPLQLATATAVIANRGKWVAPRMLKSGSGLLDASTASTMDSIDTVPGHLWDYIIESMEMVVHRGNQGYGENGTAWAYIGQEIPYRMAGKSGTAQVVEIKQGEEYDDEELDERQRKHAWFVAFAPIQAPKIALAVLLENGGGGSEFAAPVAREIIDHYLLDSTPPRVAGLAGAQR